MRPEQNGKWWRQGRWVPVALLGVYVFSMAAIFYYITLPEPRYIRPHTADDWAAWGTWLGAGFTGGALIFAGRQFRAQSQALSAELENASEERRARRDARFALAKQVKLEVIRKKSLLWRARTSAVLSDGRGYTDEEGQLTYVLIRCPAKSSLSRIAVFLPASPLMPAGAPVIQGTYEGERPRDIRVPLLKWGEMSYTRELPDLSMGNGLPDGKAGEVLKLTYVSPTERHGEGVRIVFRDENGVDFHLNEDHDLREYHGRENIGEPLSIF